METADVEILSRVTGKTMLGKSETTKLVANKAPMNGRRSVIYNNRPYHDGVQSAHI